MRRCEKRSSMIFTFLIMVIYFDGKYRPKLVPFSWGVLTRSKESLGSSAREQNCSLEEPLFPQTGQEASLEHLKILGWDFYFTVWTNNLTGHKGASGTSILVFKARVRFPQVVLWGIKLAVTRKDPAEVNEALVMVLLEDLYRQCGY